MTLSDYLFRNVPDYYDTMYLDGYTPEEIMYASKRSLYKSLQMDEAEAEPVKITSEIKLK